jgi:hypothetical protein
MYKNPHHLISHTQQDANTQDYDHKHSCNINTNEGFISLQAKICFMSWPGHTGNTFMLMVPHPHSSDWMKESSKSITVT